MADSHAKNHDYHLVDPSPWPITGSVGALTMAIGAVHWLHSGQTWGVSWLFMIGTAIVLYTMFMWWRDVVKESHAGDHTPVVQLHLRYGMLMFIASEIMFFVAWFWAFFEASLLRRRPHSGGAQEVTQGVWPPAGIEVFDPWHLPLLNTLILLLSGTTVTWAHHALINGDRKGLKWGLICTIALGVLFSSCRPMSMPRRHLPSRLRTAATSTARPSSWRPASTVSTC
jgi:cytochrome c oxidase subunit 3